MWLARFCEVRTRCDSFTYTTPSSQEVREGSHITISPFFCVSLISSAYGGEREGLLWTQMFIFCRLFSPSLSISEGSTERYRMAVHTTSSARRPQHRYTEADLFGTLAGRFHGDVVAVATTGSRNSAMGGGGSLSSARPLESSALYDAAQCRTLWLSFAATIAEQTRQAPPGFSAVIAANPNARGASCWRVFAKDVGSFFVVDRQPPARENSLTGGGEGPSRRHHAVMFTPAPSFLSAFGLRHARPPLPLSQGDVRTVEVNWRRMAALASTSSIHHVRASGAGAAGHHVPSAAISGGLPSEGSGLVAVSVTHDDCRRFVAAAFDVLGDACRLHAKSEVTVSVVFGALGRFECRRKSYDFIVNDNARAAAVTGGGSGGVGDNTAAALSAPAGRDSVQRSPSLPPHNDIAAVAVPSSSLAVQPTPTFLGRPPRSEGAAPTTAEAPPPPRTTSAVAQQPEHRRLSVQSLKDLAQQHSLPPRPSSSSTGDSAMRPPPRSNGHDIVNHHEAGVITAEARPMVSLRPSSRVSSSSSAAARHPTTAHVAADEGPSSSSPGSNSRFFNAKMRRHFVEAELQRRRDEVLEKLFTQPHQQHSMSGGRWTHEAVGDLGRGEAAGGGAARPMSAALPANGQNVAPLAFTTREPTAAHAREGSCRGLVTGDARRPASPFSTYPMSSTHRGPTTPLSLIAAAGLRDGGNWDQVAQEPAGRPPNTPLFATTSPSMSLGGQRGPPANAVSTVIDLAVQRLVHERQAQLAIRAEEAMRQQAAQAAADAILKEEKERRVAAARALKGALQVQAAGKQAREVAYRTTIAHPTMLPFSSQEAAAQRTRHVNEEAAEVNRHWAESRLQHASAARDRDVKSEIDDTQVAATQFAYASIEAAQRRKETEAIMRAAWDEQQRLKALR